MPDTKRVRYGDMFDGGLSPDEIAKATGANLQSIKTALYGTGRLCAVAQEKVHEAMRLRAEGKTQEQIAAATGISVRNVQNALAYGERNRAMVMTPDAHMRAVRGEKEMYHRKYSGELNVLLLFDPHAPHTHRPALKRALAEQGPFDLIVIGGDTMDFSVWSKFPQDDHNSMAQERQACMEVETEIVNAAAGAEVVKIKGNHDERPEKTLDANLAMMHQRMEGGAGGPRDIMLQAQRDISRWYNTIHPKVKLHEDWYLFVGNQDRPNAITHADRYTATRLKTPENVLYRLMEMQYRPQSCCIGHLHRYVPWTPVRGVWLSEMPCLCHRPKYSMKAKAGGGHHHLGHGILRTDKHGNFKPNDSTVLFGGAL